MDDDISVPSFGHASRPYHSEPGTFRQQLNAVDIFLDDPTHRDDPEGAWRMARALVMPHARRFYVDIRAAGLSARGGE